MKAQENTGFTIAFSSRVHGRSVRVAAITDTRLDERTVVCRWGDRLSGVSAGPSSTSSQSPVHACQPDITWHGRSIQLYLQSPTILTPTVSKYTYSLTVSNHPHSLQLFLQSPTIVGDCYPYSLHSISSQSPTLLRVSNSPHSIQLSLQSPNILKSPAILEVSIYSVYNHPYSLQLSSSLQLCSQSLTILTISNSLYSLQLFPGSPIIIEVSN